MTSDISKMTAKNDAVTVKNAAPFVKLELVSAADKRGGSLPIEGNNQPQQATERSVSKAELHEAVSQINSMVQSVQRDLAFSLDEDSGQTVIKVLDSKTGSLIRQIPSEEVLAIATQLRAISHSDGGDKMPQGMLFSDST
ncbi:MAG: flagellar protein FlaG [Gammaproteobacteria bacterium]|nr:flagellar protein FlaG [Gammaproteobacteria bacterium]